MGDQSLQVESGTPEFPERVASSTCEPVGTLARHEMRPHFDRVCASQVGDRYVPLSPAAVSRTYTRPTLLLATKSCCPCPLTREVICDSGSFARRVLCCEPSRRRTRPGSPVPA